GSCVTRRAAAVAGCGSSPGRAPASPRPRRALPGGASRASWTRGPPHWCASPRWWHCGAAPRRTGGASPTPARSGRASTTWSPRSRSWPARSGSPGSSPPPPTWRAPRATTSTARWRTGTSRQPGRRPTVRRRRPGPAADPGGAAGTAGPVETAATAGPAAPARAGAVLTSLILVASVANLNLAVANVALPAIGTAFDASQTELNLVAVAYSLGLAASVLYLGALGDRHGRKQMLVLGVVLAVPASVLAAWAPSVGVLAVARLAGGVSAGLAFPTTLALITALWAGPRRTRAIALWSGIGGAIAALGPLSAGALLDHVWWGAVFLVTLPLAAVALALALVYVPSHVHETSDPVDDLGGVLSVVLVAALVQIGRAHV